MMVLRKLREQLAIERLPLFQKVPESESPPLRPSAPNWEFDYVSTFNTEYGNQLIEKTFLPLILLLASYNGAQGPSKCRGPSQN